MEAITLTRADYTEGLNRVDEVCENGSYIGQFEVKLPDGLNTANTLEIVRTIQDPGLDSKIHLMRICIAGKTVEVKCPNGDTEKFCISSPEDSLEGFPLFRKEPMALLAIADCIYGYTLKKYLRPSKPKEAAATQAE